YEGGRPGGSAELARQHYERALALSNGRRASTYLALAETVVVREQDLEEFNSLLQAAMAVDPEAEPKLRLVNTIAQRRARWLETRLSDLFLGVELTELTR
ncbi:MAG: TRAP transporter TatT component family protein, partial [Pseudomonadota bacterium]